MSENYHDFPSKVIDSVAHGGILYIFDGPKLRSDSSALGRFRAAKHRASADTERVSTQHKSIPVGNFRADPRDRSPLTWDSGAHPRNCSSDSRCLSADDANANA